MRWAAVALQRVAIYRLWKNDTESKLAIS